ncbi:uncharacterized protein LOC114737214, partial [Neltuma alba]|uniref:uncharacterized protein LOC114737214 n=1 Tax=Neltuma alba TaxID=207710 RepID=UPI0010A4FDBC
MNWFTRNLHGLPERPKPQILSHNQTPKEEDEDQLYGVTEDLINYTKSFTIDTFKNFPLQDEDEATNAQDTLTNSARIRNDLSQWQERHATLILSRVKCDFNSPLPCKFDSWKRQCCASQPTWLQGT